MPCGHWRERRHQAVPIVNREPIKRGLLPSASTVRVTADRLTASSHAPAHVARSAPRCPEGSASRGGRSGCHASRTGRRGKNWTDPRRPVECNNRTVAWSVCACVTAAACAHTRAHEGAAFWVRSASGGYPCARCPLHGESHVDVAASREEEGAGALLEVVVPAAHSRSAQPSKPWSA